MALAAIIFFGGLFFILGDEDSNAWRKFINIILLIALTFIVVTCANMGGHPDSDSFMKFGDV